MLLVGCNDNLFDETGKHGTGEIIRVGGLLTDGGQMVVTQTRASGDTDPVRAETVPWMQGALLSGLDITYSNLNANGSHHTENEAVAILWWTGTSDSNTGRGDYTFKYKGTEDDAEWYDNGPHYFEGQYVPDAIRVSENHATMSIVDLTTNQTNDADYTYDSKTGEVIGGEIGNYTLLSHYVGMPPNWTTSATVDQVLLPFKHRLARVIVYILIDDQLMDITGQTTAVLEGYKGGVLSATKDDPQTTSLRFARVKVLGYVRETAPADASKTSTLTPMWTEARRVIPHFCDEFDKCYKNEPDADYDGRELAVPDTEADKYKDPANEAFLVYTNKRDEKKLHPRELGWLAAHKDFVDNGVNSAYTQQAYHRVPIYDVIVRPTYDGTDNVMYDEADYYKADKTPNTAKIENYAKEKNKIEFEMTLNNGLVYTKEFEFDLNANQQTVVYITIDRESIDYDDSTPETWVNTAAIDGYYGVNNDLGHNMSIAGSSWQRAVTYTASEPQHSVTDGNFYDDNRVDAGDLGQYFSDTNQWIEEFAKANMGGPRQGHYFVLDKDIIIDATKLPDNFVFTGHLDGRGHTITITGLNKNWTEYVATTDYSISPLYSNQSGTVFTLPTLYTKTADEIPAVYYTAEDQEVIDGEKQVGDIKTTAIPATYTPADNPSIAVVALGGYYTLVADKYTPYTLPTLYKAVAHTSGSSLFAGLNGIYDGSVGQYNLHKESGDKIIPVKGYRAELYNTTVSGGTFFPAGAVFCGSNLNLSGATVTGYIYNCFDANHAAPNNPLTNKVPIPEY